MMSDASSISERHSVCPSTAIARFARAEERIRGLSAGLPDDEITIAYEERTEALLGLILWDADPIANAILALVRAQDRLQGHFDGFCNFRNNLGVPDDAGGERDRVFADREAAILQLIEATTTADRPRP
jgi:hypothetical protein